MAVLQDTDAVHIPAGANFQYWCICIISCVSWSRFDSSKLWNKVTWNEKMYKSIVIVNVLLQFFNLLFSRTKINLPIILISWRHFGLWLLLGNQYLTNISNAQYSSIWSWKLLYERLTMKNLKYKFKKKLSFLFTDSCGNVECSMWRECQEINGEAVCVCPPCSASESEPTSRKLHVKKLMVKPYASVRNAVHRSSNQQVVSSYPLWRM